jgi:hypothetical protein
MMGKEIGMSQRTSKRIRKAKGSLEKILESLRPYLPKKQPVAVESPQKWRLPEDNYGSPEEKTKRATQPR